MIHPLIKRVAFTLAVGLFAGTAAAGELHFEHVMTLGSEGTDPGQFKYVEDFALTKDGKLLATDAAHAYVQVFDKVSGKYLSRFGGKGDSDDSLEKPEGLASISSGSRSRVEEAADMIASAWRCGGVLG